MPNLILFDVDKTLFDTSKLKAQFQPAFRDYLGITEVEFQKTYQQYTQQLKTSTDFDPVELARLFGQAYQADAEALLQLFYTPEWFAQSIFPDVEPTLTTLANTTTLGIFSEANSEFQRQKLELSGLTKWFVPEYSFIFRRKLVPEVLAELPESTVVDDKQAVVTALGDFPQILPIWLNRLSEEKNKGTPTIHQLTDLLELIWSI